METKHKAMSIIKEFRIGNLVADYETEPHYFAIEEIGLYEDGELAVWYRNGSIMDKDPDPTPLTEEWLLKAGFEFKGKRISKDWFYLWNDDNKIVFALAEMQDETGTYLEIKYVHQLQNLYFALTGKELEFKL